MQPIIDGLVSTLVVPVLVALVAAGGAWIVSKLPGPLRDALLSAVHRRDLELVLGAMARRAAAAFAAGASASVMAGGVNSALAKDVIRYVHDELPDTMAKLAPSAQALDTMAAAAVQAARVDGAVIARAGAGAAAAR